MTTFTSTFSQFDLFTTAPSSLSNHSNNVNSNDDFSSIITLEDYQTVSAADLFFFSDTDYFKDVQRQRRAEVLYKTRIRTTQNYLAKKAKSGAASLEEQHRIRNKLDQRRRQGSESSTESENEQQQSSSNEDNDHVKSKFIKSNKSPKKQLSAKKSQDSVLSSNLELECKSKNNRSNKRADRHRRPEDEVFDSDASHSDTEDDEQDHDCQSRSEGEEDEERIRFKHNLNFKTDDTEVAGRKIDTKEWKQVFEQKLDEQDQIRGQHQKKNKHGKGSLRSQ